MQACFGIILFKGPLPTIINFQSSFLLKKILKAFISSSKPFSLINLPTNKKVFDLLLIVIPFLKIFSFEQ